MWSEHRHIIETEERCPSFDLSKTATFLPPSCDYTTDYLGYMDLVSSRIGLLNTCLSFSIKGLSFSFSRSDGYTKEMLAYTLPTLLAGVALAIPTIPNFDNLMNRFRHRELSLKAADPFDRTWIESLTSIGDSYAAGLGASRCQSRQPSDFFDFCLLSS